ncbi:hypothetical protein FRC15_010935 [Serendipita sp. 397]|nr:hypothetical protein FRC15_010935 [Serendipita sp. 397]
MDSSADGFNIDLANFDIRDFVPDAGTDGNGSMFSEQVQQQQQQHRDKTRQAHQQSQMLASAHGMAQGYYGYPDSSSLFAATGNIPSAGLPPGPLSLEQLNMILSNGLGQTNAGQMSQQDEHNTSSALAASADALKEQLAQQIKLQQLQQLQNHILQQQIQLLTAGARRLPQAEVQQLLTPATTDVRSAAPSTQVSPNILPPGMFHSMSTASPHLQGQRHFDPNSSMSAPASLAFNISGVPQSPASDFLTPLTSPVFPPTSPQRAKRPADVFEGDGNEGMRHRGSRKRMAHSQSYGNLSLGMGMTSVSPALLNGGSKNRTNSLGGHGAMDTPSPIDLSMPPPAAPMIHSSSSVGQAAGYLSPHLAHSRSHSHSHLSASHHNDGDASMPLTIEGSERSRLTSGRNSSGPSTTLPSTNVSPDLLPATPAGMMNMGHLALPQGLIPPTMNQPSASKPQLEEAQTIQGSPQKRAKNSRSRGASISTSMNSMTVVASSAATTTSTAMASGSSKPKRAAASAAAASNRAVASATSGRNNFGGPKVKSTHKDAEQKRRDSLKTSFDELRNLLPPIPLSSTGLGGEDSDDPPLPGAMPPRGPPRGDGDGPNKGVSKLVLLRCGNEFIRDLIGKVERRDDEIHKLRKEIRALRATLGGMSLGMGSAGMYAGGFAMEEDVEMNDLDKDFEKEDEQIREERRRARKKQKEESEAAEDG